MGGTSNHNWKWLYGTKGEEGDGATEEEEDLGVNSTQVLPETVGENEMALIIVCKVRKEIRPCGHKL